MDTSQIRTKFTEMSKIFKNVVDEYESLKSQTVILQEENEGLREELDIAFFEYDKIKSQNKELNLILEDFGECDNERRSLKEELKVLKAQKCETDEEEN